MKFDENYKLLEEMYADSYYPKFLVDKIRKELQKVIQSLESGETKLEQVQQRFDAMTIAVNDLQEEFDANDSEIESMARDCIATDVIYILDWFSIDLDVEDALRERDW